MTLVADWISESATESINVWVAETHSPSHSYGYERRGPTGGPSPSRWINDSLANESPMTAVSRPVSIAQVDSCRFMPTK